MPAPTDMPIRALRIDIGVRPGVYRVVPSRAWGRIPWTTQ